MARRRSFVTPLSTAAIALLAVAPDSARAQDQGDAQPQPLTLSEGDTTRARAIAGSRLRLPSDGDPLDPSDDPAFNNDKAVSVTARKRPLYDAPGFPLGGLTLYPEVSAGARYDSNVFALNDAQDDVFGTLRASVKLVSNWGLNALDFTGYVDERAFAKYTSESGITYQGRLRGRLDLDRDSSLTGEIERQRVFVRRGGTGEEILTRRPVRYDLTSSAFTYARSFGRIGTKLGGYVGKYDYQDAQRPDGTPFSQRYRDYTLYRGDAEAGYTLPNGWQVFVSGMAEFRRYRVRSVPLDRDTDGFELLAGVQSEITPLIRGRLSAGYIYANFKDPTVGSRGAVAIDADLDYLITELTTIRLTGRRYFQNVASVSAPGGLATEITLGADHELLRNLILSATTKYRTTKFVVTDTRSTNYELNGGARWFVNRHLRISGDLNFRNRRGGGVATDRRYNEVEGGVSVAYAL